MDDRSIRWQLGVAVVSPQSAGNRRRYRFGEFLIDPASRELRRGRQLLAISPKVFDCIAYLIKHKDRAVGRDELIAAVWGRADVADVQLRYLMRKIRRTLDDDGEGQKLIRTIPRFGFHWVAELADEDASQVSAAPLSAAPHSIAPRGEPAAPAAARPLKGIVPATSGRFASASPRARIVLNTSIALLFVAGFVLSAYGLHVRQATGSNAAENARSNSPSHAIAVLPVAVDSIKDPDASWMAFGLMDLIAHRLQRVGLLVVSSSDVIALARDGQATDALNARVRTTTHADVIIATSVRRNAGGWLLQTDALGDDGKSWTVEAQSVDAMLAARELSDRLVEKLGGKPANGFNSSKPSTTELFQRVEAALLVDDVETARGLIECGVIHAERLEDVIADVVLKPLAGDALDDVARQAGAIV